MKDVIERLRKTLETAPARLLALGEAGARERPMAQKWSRKEILGHLIDSASNNHQRFVRAQLASELSFPPYDGDAWVATEGFQDEPWAALVGLWLAYNRHLLHVMGRVPADKLAHRCRVAEDEPVALGDHMRGYVDHLEHHLAQILGPGAA